MKTTKRRDRGSGCIRKRKDRQGWEGQFTQGPLLPKKSIYGKSKQEVQAKWARWRLEPTQVHDPEKLSIAEWMDRFLEIVKDTRRFKTYTLYKAATNNHIKPYVGSVRLASLSKSQVYEMFDGLKKDKIGDPTLQVVYKVLHRAINVALQRDKVTSNVVALVDAPKSERGERHFLRTPDEIYRFRMAVEGSVFEPLYLLALDSACRQGELLALRWEKVDLVSGVIHINATLTENEAGNLVATPPKTKSSVRSVRLPQYTVDMLKKHRKTTMDPKRVQSEWVFANWDGKPVRKDGFLRREFPRLLKAAKLPPMSFHGLRRTHATLLAGLGVSARATQDRLGHEDPRMTIGTYQHTTGVMEDQVIAALERFYEQPTPGGKPPIVGQFGGQSANADHDLGNQDTRTLTG